MLSVADWVMHAKATEIEQHHHNHEKLRKKILSHYKEMEAKDILEYDKESDEFYETNAYDDYLHAKFIEPYGDGNFWDELIDRLAARDLINTIGIEAFNSLKGIERGMEIAKLRERYANEFAEYGLEHIKVQYDDIVKN